MPSSDNNLPTRYEIGTASVEAGSPTVTPHDAVWLGNAWGDDLFCLPSQPLVPPIRVETVNEDGTLTLSVNWPGETAAEAGYEIRYVGMIERSTRQSRRVLEELQVVEAIAWGLFYRFDEATADGDPGPGNLRLNHADPASVTEIFIDDIDAGGAAAGAEIDSWGATLAPIRGKVWLRSIPNPAGFLSYAIIGGVVDDAGRRKLLVTYVSGSAGFAAGEALRLGFVPNGSQGAGFEYDAESPDIPGLAAYDEEDPGYRVWVYDLDGGTENDPDAGRAGVVTKDDEGAWPVTAYFTGTQGQVGPQGTRGWSPVYAGETVGSKDVRKLIDYVGGTGTKPTFGIGFYEATSGLVEDPEDPTVMNYRGATGDIEGVTSFWVGRITVDTTPSAARTGLGINFSNQAQAQGGTDTTTFMNPLRVAQAIAAQVPEGRKYDLEAAQFGLKFSLLASAAYYYGGGANGTGVGDGLTSLGLIDVANASNLDTSEAGVLKPGINASVSVTDTASITSDLTTYTFTDMDAGDAAADRFMVALVAGRSSATGARTVSSVTIGGVAATLIASVPAVADVQVAAIYGAELPAGATATVAVTFNGAMLRAGCHLMRMTGVDPTAVDTASGTALTNNLTIDTVEGGVAIGIGIANSGNTGNHVVNWTGMGSVAETTPEDILYMNSAVQAFSEELADRPITVGLGGSSERGVVIASFAPSGAPFADMSVASEAFDTVDPPNQVTLLALIEEVDEAVIGDDYLFEVTRDDTDWTTIDMAYVITDNGLKQYWGTADVSGLGSGTTVKWRMSTTAVMVELHGYAISWK